MPTGAPATWLFQSSWSAFARSAPFIEQGSFYNSINFDLTYSDPPNTTVSNLPLPFLYCPSDPGSPIDDNTLGGTGYATTSYGTCDGDWYVWSVNWGATNSVGPMNRSLFGPNYSRKISNVTDGLSNTLMASEGLIGHAQMRSCTGTQVLRLAIQSLAPTHSPTSQLLVKCRSPLLPTRSTTAQAVLEKSNRVVRSVTPGGVTVAFITLVSQPLCHPTRAFPLLAKLTFLRAYRLPTSVGMCRWTGTGLMRMMVAGPTCRWRPAATITAGLMQDLPMAVFITSGIRSTRKSGITSGQSPVVRPSRPMPTEHSSI